MLFRSSYEGKVDKQIVKSLLISYFATVPGTQARTEGERLLARFLDFNQQEMERAGIRIGKQAKSSANDSFTFKFVEFLESESSKSGTTGQDNQSGRRRDSTASNASQVGANNQNMELARDLNKRLNLLGSSASATTTAGGPRPNPFVPQSQSAVYQHHRTPSSTSSASSTSFEHVHINQLLQPTGVPTNTPILIGSQSQTSVHSQMKTTRPSGVSISDIVRDAVESEDQII